MSHQDGRCASEAETVYVQNVVANCSDPTAGAGTRAMPYCSMQPAVAAVGTGATRDLVVVLGTVAGAPAPFSVSAKQLTVVGQGTGAIGAVTAPPFHLASGDAYLRDVKLGPSPSIGVQANAGSTLRLQHVVVDGNHNGSAATAGGILLDGAAFDIRNTTVTNNGPGTLGSTTWGGILINNPPTTGPRQLQFLTVQTNNPVGISCSAAVTASGVSGILASGNTSVEISPTCMFTSCGTASLTCGAQP